MKKWNREKILFLYFSLLLSFFSFSQSNKKDWVKSLTNISKDRPQDRIYLTAADSTGYRTPLKVPKKIEDFSRRPSTSSLIYPILFIHGLDSNSDTWKLLESASPNYPTEVQSSLKCAIFLHFTSGN